MDTVESRSSGSFEYLRGLICKLLTWVVCAETESEEVEENSFDGDEVAVDTIESMSSDPFEYQL